MIQKLSPTAEHVEVQETAFSIDVLGRYVCNTWDEAVHNGGAPFDVVVIGAGMFGAYAAAKAYREGAALGLRVLVLEAGPFLVSEHVQNLARVGLNAPGPVAHDPGHARERVWGLPWRSNQPFVGLAYAVGGRSLYWGGWAPRLTEADLAAWPPEIAQFLRQAYKDVEGEIGSAATADYIHGDLQKELKRQFTSAAKGVPTVDKVENAPLAVQGAAPRSGLFSFDKFSSAPILIDAIREHRAPDAQRRLFLVPRAHVTRLETQGALVTGIRASVNGEEKHLPLAPHASVILALGTIETTRLALESFPTPLMGRNLVGHLRSNLVVRVKRSQFSDVDKQTESAALLVRGSTPQGRYHVQVTAVGSDGTNSEEEMWRMIPDIDLVHRMQHNQPDWIVMTLRGIGEMKGVRTPNSADHSWMDLSPYEHDEFGRRRAYVHLVTTPDDEQLWAAMNQATLQLAQKLSGGDPTAIQYLVKGQWSPAPPSDAQVRDKLGTTHHEACTLWMGADPNASVTTLDGRFHHVANAYVAGPAIFPTLGSANPALTALALARRTAKAAVAARATPIDPGFTELLQPGLEGWRMSGAGGFVASGNLVESRGGPGILCYAKKELADFVLRVEYRQTGWFDNAGVFLRTPPLGAGDWKAATAQGYEVQIDERGYDPHTGRENDPFHATGAIYELAPVQRKAANPIGAWNLFEIEAAGDRITVRLNGQVVSEHAGAPRNRTGQIGLQNHHDGSRVQFRSVRVKEL